MSRDAADVTTAAETLGALADADQPKVALVVSVHTLISGEATPIIAHGKTEFRRVEFHTDIDATRFGVSYRIHDGLTADAKRRVFESPFQATAPTGGCHGNLYSQSRGSFLGNRLQR